MSVITYQQAKVVYQEATLDTEEIIASLLAAGEIHKRGAKACRSITITPMGGRDAEGHVHFEYSVIEGLEYRAFYDADDDILYSSIEDVSKVNRESVSAFLLAVMRIIGRFQWPN